MSFQPTHRLPFTPAHEEGAYHPRLALQLLLLDLSRRPTDSKPPAAFILLLLTSHYNLGQCSAELHSCQLEWVNCCAQNCLSWLNCKEVVCWVLGTCPLAALPPVLRALGKRMVAEEKLCGFGNRRQFLKPCSRHFHLQCCCTLGGAFRKSHFMWLPCWQAGQPSLENSTTQLTCQIPRLCHPAFCNPP